MDNFSFYSPTKFAFGKDTENQAGKLVKEFGGKAEDIPQLVKNFGLPEGGKTGGFVQLSAEDIAEIYKLAL